MHTDPSVGNVWVNAVTFDNLSNARKMEAILRQNGFETLLQNERQLQKFWFAAKRRAGIHIQIRSKDLEPVSNCFNTVPEARVLFQKAIRCPSCNSARVQYPAMTRKNLLPALVAQVGVVLGIQKHEFYCETCQFTWAPGEIPVTTSMANHSLKV